jgi:hypothetical protein
MSIVISKPAPALVASENDIVIEAYENDIASNYGTSSRGFLYLNAFHLPGDYINIHFSIDGIITYYSMTCVATVTDNTIQYPVRTTETMAEWGEKIKDMFCRNAFILENFKVYSTIELNGNAFRIWFEPYDPTNVSMIFYSVNVSVDISVQNTVYTAPAYYSYISMCLQLYIETQTDATHWTQEKSSSNPFVLPPVIFNKKAYGHWNLKNAVKNEYTGHFTFPLDGARHYHYIVDSYTPYIYSKHGNPPTAQNGKFANSIYVLDAKFSDMKIRELNEADKSIADLLNETKQFLTNAPLEKATDIYVPEKLNWLFRQAYTNAVARVKEYYTDGTNEIRTITTFNATAWSIMEFESGFQTIKRSDYENAGVMPYKWDFWLETSAGAYISEIRTYFIDKTYQPYARYWIFKNRWGVYEAVRSTGAVQKLNKIEKTFFEQDPEEPGLSDKKVNQVDETNELSITVNTGWLEKNIIAWMADELNMSRDVYWLKENNKYAVTVEANTVTFEEDGNHNYAFDFKALVDDISDSMYDEFDPVPELPVVGDFNGDFNDDYLI